MVRYTWRHFLKELFPFATPFRKTIAAVILFTLLSVGLDLLEPIVYKNVLNDLSGVFVHHTIKVSKTLTHEELSNRTLLPHKRNEVLPRTSVQAFQTLTYASIALFLINTISYIFYLMADYFSAKYASGIEQNFIARLFEHVLSFKLQFFRKNTTGSLVKKIDQTDQVGPAVTAILEGVTTEFFQLGGAMAIMFYHNVNLAFASLITLPFYFFVSSLMAKKLESNSDAYLGKWDDVSTKLQDNLNHIKTVKTSGAEERVAKKFSFSLTSALTEYLKRAKSEGIYGFLQNLCVNVGRLIVLIYGSYSVIHSEMTPGEVVMFSTLLDQMYDPINALTSNLVNLQIDKVSIARGLSLFHHRGESRKQTEYIIRQPDVEFRSVGFSYVKGQPVLKDMSFKLKPRAYNVIVGPSGAGKSTILDLILGFYKVDAGEILIDGTNIEDIGVLGLRSQIGLVAADGAVFRGSLRENILFKNPQGTDQDVLNAVEESGLTRALERLDEGLDTEVGDQGIGLSLGERQRLQFARMLVSRPKIILLDEATSNLDYLTEQEIRGILRKIKSEATILVVAHRYSMVEDSDHVIVLGQGKVVCEGTLSEVKDKNEWFRKMAIQAGQA